VIFLKVLLTKHGKGQTKNVSAQEPHMGILVDATNGFLSTDEGIGVANIAGKPTM